MIGLRMANTVAEGFPNDIEKLSLFISSQHVKCRTLKVQGDLNMADVVVNGLKSLEIRFETGVLNHAGIEFVDHLPDLADQLVDLTDHVCGSVRRVGDVVCVSDQGNLDIR